jgi:hypothetical protein
MKTMNIKQLAFAVSVAMLLSGCATKYQKKTIWDGLGYTDEKIAEGVYRITYLVNANTPAEDAVKYWHQRATELCGSSDYDHDEKLTSQNNRDYNPAIFSYQDHYFPYVEGTATCKKR